MKKIRNTIVKIAVLVAVALLSAAPAKAQQMQMIPNAYFNVDWQVNVPVGNDFTSKASGWGMNFEGGYYLGQSYFALGGFMAFHTNNEYFDAQVVPIGSTGSLYSDQEHTTYRLPFGVSGRYRLTDGWGVLDPYISLKLGAQFARMTSYYGQYESYDETWGFYMSPEIGTAIWASANHSFGFHLALYFDYGTNSTNITGYKVDNLSNFGVRVGMQF